MNTIAQHIPEFEINQGRGDSVFYLEHGFPNALVRWHYHDDYELHYIAHTSGKVFVGDYIGQFEPGNFVLTGPRLPHNWISQIDHGETYALRDRLVQFDQHLIDNMAKAAPELDELLPMLDRAKYGIEFKGAAQYKAEAFMKRIRLSSGAKKITLLIDFLQILAEETQYKLLSTVSMKCNADESSMNKIDLVANYVTVNYAQSISLATVAELVGMSESAFSRFFTKATGNGFNEFLNRVRISRACELLAHTSQPVTNICFTVGFNNVANFNRRFRRMKKITPREYREEVQQRIHTTD